MAAVGETSVTIRSALPASDIFTAVWTQYTSRHKLLPLSDVCEKIRHAEDYVVCNVLKIAKILNLALMFEAQNN